MCVVHAPKWPQRRKKKKKKKQEAGPRTNTRCCRLRVSLYECGEELPHPSSLSPSPFIPRQFGNISDRARRSHFQRERETECEKEREVSVRLRRSLSSDGGGDRGHFE